MRRYVIYAEGYGVYLGNFLGLPFWSRLNPARQSSAMTFVSEAVARKFSGSWFGIVPMLRFVEVIADLDDGLHASKEACVKAGLPSW